MNVASRVAANRAAAFARAAPLGRTAAVVHHQKCQSRHPRRTFSVTIMAYRENPAGTGPADVPAAQAEKTSGPTIKLGDKLPMDKVLYIFEEGADAPRKVPIGDLVRGKKAVLFGLPGAYTSICSSKHVPQFFQKREELKAKGVQLIGCISVNDAYVMRAWAKDLGVDPNAIKMLADGDASFSRAIGLQQTLPGLGERSMRYSMYVDDGVVKVLNVEEAGGKSYKVSGPEHMLKDLEALGV